MKIQIVILAILIALLLAVSTALAQPARQVQPAWYTVEHRIASGGRYHLLGPNWQAGGAASGAGYHLLGPSAPASSENGCCCTFLPCVLRSR